MDSCVFGDNLPGYEVGPKEAPGIIVIQVSSKHGGSDHRHFSRNQQMSLQDVLGLLLEPATSVHTVQFYASILSYTGVPWEH